MTEASSSDPNITTDANPEVPKKPIKVEDKPFEEFIRDDFIATLEKELTNKTSGPVNITFDQGKRPVLGDICWIVRGELTQGRTFWICFKKNQLTSNKTITLAEAGRAPSMVEPFLIDEKKTTLVLLMSRLLQRLNGQKWLQPN